jgi:hypothetical protein
MEKNLHLKVKAVPGDRVKVPELEQRAVVRSVTINQGGTIQYEICYFATGERKSVYLFADEFELA